MYQISSQPDEVFRKKKGGGGVRLTPLDFYS